MAEKRDLTKTRAKKEMTYKNNVLIIALSVNRTYFCGFRENPMMIPVGNAGPDLGWYIKRIFPTSWNYLSLILTSKSTIAEATSFFKTVITFMS